MKRIDVVYSLITAPERDKILMVRNKDSDSWTLPGGTVEAGETLESAAIREVKEETGLDIKVHGLVAVNEAFLEASQEHAIFFTFRAEITGGLEQITRPDEITDIQWVGIDQSDEWMPYYKEGLKEIVHKGHEVTYFYEGKV